MSGRTEQAGQAPGARPLGPAQGALVPPVDDASAAVVPAAGAAAASSPSVAGDVAAPVALVAVGVPLPHLDRAFEYRVTAETAEAAVPGARVKVRFSGREVDGFVLERRDRAEHLGALSPLRRVVSPEPVLTPEVLRLARAVADAHAGSLADVLRLAVPPRHAAAEKALTQRPPAETEALAAPETPGAAWARYPAGASFVRRLAAGEAPWAAWSALPSTDPDLDWPAAFAAAAHVTLAAGRESSSCCRTTGT